MKKKHVVTVISPNGEATAEGSNAGEAFKIAQAASIGMVLDGHRVIAAERLLNSIQATTKCYKTIHINIPLSKEDAKRSKGPVTCNDC